MSDFFHLEKLIPKALARYKLDRQAQAAKVCERFRRLASNYISPDALDFIKPKSFKRHTLYVSVPSSVWAQKVIVHRHELIEALNESLTKAQAVHEIRTLVE